MKGDSELQKLRYDNKELREAVDRLAARIEALEAALRKGDVDLAFCREAMRHAEIDLCVVLPLVNSDIQKSIRKTLNRFDEARARAALAPEQGK